MHRINLPALHMNDPFQIWVDRLKGGKTQKINESLDPSFLDVQEEELRLDAPVIVIGEAYLSDNELILRLTASTQVSMPCAICNQMIPVKLAVNDFYHAHPLDEIPSAIYDFRIPLREALLIELPKYVECNQGKCPERKVIAPYMRSGEKIKKDTHFPFSNLDS